MTFLDWISEFVFSSSWRPAVALRLWKLCHQETAHQDTKNFLIIKPLGVPLCLRAFVAIFMTATPKPAPFFPWINYWWTWTGFWRTWKHFKITWKRSKIIWKILPCRCTRSPRTCTNLPCTCTEIARRFSWRYIMGGLPGSISIDNHCLPC